MRSIEPLSAIARHSSLAGGRRRRRRRRSISSRPDAAEGFERGDGADRSTAEPRPRNHRVGRGLDPPAENERPWRRLRNAIFRTALEALYFSGAHAALRARGRRRRRDPDAASCAPGARGTVPAEPAAGGDARLFRGVVRGLRRIRASISCRWMKCTAAWSSGISAAASSASPSTTAIATRSNSRIRSSSATTCPMRSMSPTQLRRSDRRDVVAGARSRDRAQQPLIAGGSTARRGPFRVRMPYEKRAAVRRGLLVAAPAHDARTSFAPSCATCRSVTASTSAASARDLCMDWQEIAELAADPLVTIGAHTVNHPILAKLTEAQARSELAEQRRGYRGGARPAAAASGLSGWRSDLGRPARIPIAGGARLQDRGDDAAGRPVSGALRAI